MSGCEGWSAALMLAWNKVQFPRSRPIESYIRLVCPYPTIFHRALVHILIYSIINCPLFCLIIILNFRPYPYVFHRWFVLYMVLYPIFSLYLDRIYHLFVHYYGLISYFLFNIDVFHRWLSFMWSYILYFVHILMDSTIICLSIIWSYILVHILIDSTICPLYSLISYILSIY